MQNSLAFATAPHSVRHAGTLACDARRRAMASADLSGVLLSHRRGALHNEFPQFPQVLRQSRSPFSDHRGGGNNQAPKRGVLRFDPPGFEGLRARDHNMNEAKRTTPRKIADRGWA